MQPPKSANPLFGVETKNQRPLRKECFCEHRTWFRELWGPHATRRRLGLLLEQRCHAGSSGPCKRAVPAIALINVQPFHCLAAAGAEIASPAKIPETDV